MRLATTQAIFDDVCNGLNRASDPSPETAVAIRDGHVGLWATAPVDSPIETRRRLLGLAAPAANASVLLFIADTYVQLDGSTSRVNAMLSVAITFGEPEAIETRIRPYTVGRRGVRSGRLYEDDITFDSSAAQFGSVISDLLAADAAGRDSHARITATKAMLSHGFDLQFSKWLDEELSALIG